MSSFAAASALGASEAVQLPTFSVLSPRVAMQEPAATFAMPVSALRYEPLVDVQARNLAEGQADIAIRGGIFENTGFKVGALSLYDPQTGHYFAEIPVAPNMLTAPEILTGANNASAGWNSNAGTVAYRWREIQTGGQLTASVGEAATRRGEFYQGWRSGVALGGASLAADVSVAHSRSDGLVRFGEHEFTRYNARIQLAGEGRQTDLFYGYQSKFFGWPNLYTPYANVFETENLQTNLAGINHRAELGGGEFWEVGGYYRRNKNNYVFNRTDPGAYNPAFATGPAHHTSWVYGASAQGRFVVADFPVNLAATFIDEDLTSTSLVFGRFKTRQHAKLAIVPEKTWQLEKGRRLTLEAGASYDHATEHSDSNISPIVQLTWDRLAPALGVDALYVSYAESTQVPTYLALNSRATAGLFRGNPDLDRETARNLELGGRGEIGAWVLDAAFFFRRDEQLVDWVYASTVPNARAASAVDIDTAGVEAVARFSAKAVDLVFGYTGLTKSADYGAATVDASFYALNYPKHRLTAAAVVRIGGGWEARMDNEFRWQATNALRASDDHAALSSIGLYFTPPRFAKLRFAIEVENLWDSDFQEVPAVPASPRYVSGGVAYAW